MKKILLFTLIFLLSFGMIFPVSNADVGDILLTDWDDCVQGTKSGTSDSVTYQNMTNSFYISDDYYTKCIKIADGGDGWINLTDTYDYISNVTLILRVENVNENWNLHIRFYKDTVEVLRFWFDLSAGDDYLYAYDSEGNSDGMYAPRNYGNLSFQHIGLNELRMGFIDPNGYAYTYKNTSSTVTANWTSFDSIHVYEESGAVSATGYIDKIIINQNENSESGLPEVTGISVWQDDVSGIHDVNQNTQHSYEVTKLGDTNCRAWIRVYKPDGSIYYQQLMLLNYVSFSLFYTTTGNYTFMVTDYFDDSVYNESTVFEVIATSTMDDFDTYYGAFYAEWYKEGLGYNLGQCPYEIGDYPDIIYHVNDSYLGLADFYFLQIKELLTNETIFMSKITAMDETNILHVTTPFSDTYTYVIRLFNASPIALTWIQNELLYESSPLSVCDNDIPPTYTNVYSYSTNPQLTEKLDYNPVTDWYIGGLFSSYFRPRILYGIDSNHSLTLTVNRVSGTDEYKMDIIGASGTVVATRLCDNENSFTYTIDFDTLAGGYADAVGFWTIQVFDCGGGYLDSNAMNIFLYVALEGNSTLPPDVSDEFGYGLFPVVSGPLGAILGMIIVISCVILPLLIGGQYGVDVPVFAYALSGGVGVVVSTTLGLFPSYTIFFLVAIGIIIVFMMWLVGRQNGGE